MGQAARAASGLSNAGSPNRSCVKPSVASPPVGGPTEPAALSLNTSLSPSVLDAAFTAPRRWRAQSGVVGAVMKHRQRHAGGGLRQQSPYRRSWRSGAVDTARVARLRHEGLVQSSL